MLYVVTILQFLSILSISLYEYYRKSTAVFLWATLLLMFGFMHSLAIFTGEAAETQDIYNASGIFVFLFSCFYIFSRTALNGFVLRNLDYTNVFKKKYKISYTVRERRFVLALSVLLVFIVLTKIYTLVKYSGGIMNTSWGEAYTMEKKYFDPNIILRFFYYPSVGLIYVMLVKKKRWVVCFLSLLVLAMVMTTRNKMEILPLAVVFIFYLVNNVRLNLKAGILYLIIAIASIYVLSVLQVYRHAGSINTLKQKYDNFSEFNADAINYVKTGGVDLTLYKDFHFFIEHENQFENFNKGHTYIRMLLVCVPSQYAFGLKPPDFAISMGRAVKPEATNYSTHPTFFGNVYANFGKIGVLMGIFWAFFFTLIDQIINKSPLLLKYCFAVMFGGYFIFVGRGSVYNNFMLMFYGWIFMGIFYEFVTRTTFKKRSLT